MFSLTVLDTMVLSNRVHTARKQRGKQPSHDFLAPALGYKQNGGMFGEAKRPRVEGEGKNIDEKKRSVLLGYSEQRKDR